MTRKPSPNVQDEHVVRKDATAILIQLMKVDEDNVPPIKEESFLDLVLRNSKMSRSCSR